MVVVLVVGISLTSVKRNAPALGRFKADCWLAGRNAPCGYGVLPLDDARPWGLFLPMTFEETWRVSLSLSRRAARLLRRPSQKHHCTHATDAPQPADESRHYYWMSVDLVMNRATTTWTRLTITRQQVA